MNLTNVKIWKNKNNIIPKMKIRVQLYENNTKQETIEMTRRLLLQNLRRPTNLIINIIQPLLWLLLFGGLFQNAPIYLFEHYKLQYKEFLHPGIIIFTGFNNAINSGLTIVFDREFGFFNRILVSPISNKKSLIYSSIIHAWLTSIIQVLIMTVIPILYNQKYINLNVGTIIFQIFISSIIITNVSIISICNALLLPGHIEFIALTTLLINLPTLFTSTALAPLSFMPIWLQIICCINPLTYAIEAIRNQLLNSTNIISDEIIKIGDIIINFRQSIVILLIFNVVSFVIIEKIIKYKYD